MVSYVTPGIKAIILRALAGQRPLYQNLLDLPLAQSGEFGSYGGCCFGPGPDDPNFSYTGSGTSRLGGIYYRSQSHLGPHAAADEPSKLLRKYFHDGHGRLYKTLAFMEIPGSQATPKGSDARDHFRVLAVLGEEVFHHLFNTWTERHPFPEQAMWDNCPWVGLNKHPHLGFGFSLGRSGEILHKVHQLQKPAKEIEQRKKKRAAESPEEKKVRLAKENEQKKEESGKESGRDPRGKYVQHGL